MTLQQALRHGQDFLQALQSAGKSAEAQQVKAILSHLQSDTDYDLQAARASLRIDREKKQVTVVCALMQDV